MIKIAISGAGGRMGRSVIEASQNFGLESVSLDKGDDLVQLVQHFDILIDFTHPLATLNYLETCTKFGKKMVIGTTGFSDKELVKLENYGTKIPIVFAPNMSIGVNLTFKLLAMSSQIIGEDADIEIVEAHHRYKVDAPSGTALKMAEVVANALGRDLKTCTTYSRQGISKPREKGTIGFSTVRGGDIIGEHNVYFFLDGECIEISHKASSRQIFANGAIKAAMWLEKQSRPGLYNMQDVLGL